jgi:hypothetical protein
MPMLAYGALCPPQMASLWHWQHNPRTKILVVVHAWWGMPFQNERLKPDQYIILRRLVGL